MENRLQQTIADIVTFRGVGLHTGEESILSIKPAEENSGIVFNRIDIGNNATIPADVSFVSDTTRGTTLARDGIKIHTVEHILAALRGLNIDNAKIDLTAPEPPIMDGSALPFVSAIEKVGVVAQNIQQEYYEISEPIIYYDAERDIEINILPFDKPKITFFLDYGLPNFDSQYCSIEDIEAEFSQEIAPARTFGLLSEIVQLKQNNLIKGGSLENAVIIIDKKINKKEQKMLNKLFNFDTQFNFNNDKVLNFEGLRFENEPVRHKILDLIGDLALLGKPFRGHIIAEKSGHSANIEIIKMIKSKLQL